MTRRIVILHSVRNSQGIMELNTPLIRQDFNIANPTRLVQKLKLARKTNKPWEFLCEVLKIKLKSSSVTAV